MNYTNNPIFDDKTLNKLDKNIYEIPQDVKTKIYKEYFEPQIIAENLCDKLLIELNSVESRNLVIRGILPLLEELLQNKLAINILIKNNNIFEMLYNDLCIQNKKNFINLSLMHDFALSWLMTLYH